MTARVGIVATAQTKYEEAKPKLHLSELLCEVVEEVLAKTGLAFTRDGTGLEDSVTCCSDHWDGQIGSSKNAQDVAGGDLRESDNVASGGASAFFLAIARLLSHRCDTILVTAHCKESQGEPRLIENMGFDPVYLRMLGLDFLSAAALQANRYMHKYGITSEQCAKVVVKNRGNAKNNPFSQAPLDLTVDDVLNSPMLAFPLKLLETKPVSDGACAIILATEEKAKKLTDKPVWVTGISSCYDSYYLGDRDLADCRALAEAARRAYSMAGVSDPRKEMDLVELSEYCAYQELLWLEGLGFCGRGEGGRLIDSGVAEMGNELPVNPSGGLLSGVPTMVDGLSRIAEVALQLKGEAGARQMPGAKKALAHSVMGVAGQMHCVAVLEK
ncbi:thiolase family protein [Chloroflexota bacterium]